MGNFLGKRRVLGKFRRSQRFTIGNLWQLTQFVKKFNLIMTEEPSLSKLVVKTIDFEYYKIHLKIKKSCSKLILLINLVNQCR